MDRRFLEQFSKVVDSIYEAALSPDLWPIAVEGVARLHQSPKANFLTPSVAPVKGGFVFPYGLSESILQIWDAEYRSDDVWFQASARKGLIKNRQVMLTHDMMTREEFENSRHYREFLKEIDISDICTAVIFDGTSSPTLLTVFSVFRGHRDSPFPETNRTLHSLLTSHVSRALGVMFRLRFADLQIASNIAALNRLAIGVLLFVHRGNVVFVNKLACSILERSSNGLALQSGNPLTDSLGWLRATNVADDEVLKREIAAAVSTRYVRVTHFAQGVSMHRSFGKNPLLLQLSALSPNNEFSHHERLAFAIGFLSDPDSPLRLDPTLLVRAYGLTGAECALAQELLSGAAMKQIAIRLGLSPNTIKTQLEGIFAKTGTHRQAQLVKLLTAFAAPA